MKRIHILLAALVMPIMLTAQPGRIGQPQMRQPQMTPQMTPQMAPQMQPQPTAIDAELQKLLVAEGAISALYVEDVDEKKLVEKAIIGMLEELDPHSTYLTAEENDKSNETLMGSFDGIGVQFNMVEDTLFIVQPIPDGPSERVGILSGDRIITVNDTAIAGVKMSQEAIMKRLRGPRGTKVKLGVNRRGVNGMLYFTVIRDKTDGHGNFRDGKLVVLIDEYSASASEIVSGAVQDWDRATIVGRRSFGKGLVQRPIEFHDGSLIRLTIAKYYTPVGRCIQKPYGKDVDYGDDIEERLRHGELTNRDSIHFPDSLKYTTMVNHRTVYGGGGIMPDIFVPLDTTRINQYYRNVTAKNVVFNTSFKYVERNRRSLTRRYRTFQDFNRAFEVGPDVLKAFLDKAKEDKVEYNEEQYQHCLPIFKTQLKATIARLLWGMNAYYQVIQELDESVQRAVVYMETGQ